MPARPRLRCTLYVDAAGEHRWRLVGRNGRTVADSGEGYKTAAGVRRAVALLAACADVAFTRAVFKMQADDRNPKP